LAGTRPEVIKLSEFVRKFKNIDHTYVYTGQHYSSSLKDVFFDELESKPDVDLGLETPDVETIAQRTTRLLEQVRPSLVIVYGDTNSTMAGALAAERCKIPLLHIEAGLRSFDLRMGEERNRMKIDRMSNYLLCPTSLSAEFLKYEGIVQGVAITGNLIVDVVRKFVGRDRKLNFDLPTTFLLLTLHRAENVDDPNCLRMLMERISAINIPIIFPIHPRTRKMLLTFNIQLPQNIVPTDPLGYLDFLELLKKCTLVLTDSGGIQEEAAILSRPCITLRQTTERWETILCGANRLFPLVSNDSADLGKSITEMISKPMPIQPYGENVTDRTLREVSDAFDSIVMNPRVH
jgi:UDP-N-acetylglucosamine 2-epimerase